VLDWLRRALAKTVSRDTVAMDRRVRVQEHEKIPPSERFVLSIALMIVFFLGLVALEIAYMVVLGDWSDTIFNGVMLIVGGLVGALFGYREAPL